MMIRKITAGLLIVSILLSVSYCFAEDPGTLLSAADLQYQEQLFEQTRPLLELTAAASILSGELPVEFDAGDVLPYGFVQACASLLPRYSFGMPEDLLGWLTANYAVSFKESGEEKQQQSIQYVGLFMLDLTPSPENDQFAVTAEVYMAPKQYEELSAEDWNSLVWTDQMAIMTLKKEERAATGWQVTSLHYASAYFSDDTDVQHVEGSAFDTYYSEKYGCSVSYPSLFDEETAALSDDGMSCDLPDGSASVRIHLNEESACTQEEAVQQVISEHPDISFLSTELDDIACLEYTEGKRITRWFCAKASGTVITVSLSWDMDLHSDFADLADRMMQSLISEEDSLG